MNSIPFRSIFLSSIGNVLEWYDFGLFSSFAFIFSGLFFPDTNPHIALIEIFGIYAIGFICRPIGALVFGMLGDRIGRAKTLRASILVMSLPTFMIALLPTYAMAGIFAPILLILLRLIQGISLGGEFTGIIIYLTESAPKKHRALFASLVGISTILGFLLASSISGLLAHILSSENFKAYGWRIAFVAGGLFGYGVFYLRRYLSETKSFKQVQKSHQIVKLPIITAFKTTPLKMLLTVCLVSLGGIFYYLCFVYLFNTFQQIGLSSTESYLLQMGCFAVMLVLVPLGGWVCDWIGRKKSFLLISFSVFCMAWPGFYLISTHSLQNIIIAMAVFTLISSFEQGTTTATVVEQFPAQILYSGLSLSYNVAQALFGGTAPFLASFLVLKTQDFIAPAFYLMAIAAVVFFVSLFFLKDTRHVKLENE